MMAFMKERNADEAKRAKLVLELLAAKAGDELKDKVAEALPFFELKAIKDYLKIKTHGHEAVKETSDLRKLNNTVDWQR